MTPYEYEVVLASTAKREVLSLRTSREKDALADALRVELDNGPNSDREYQFKCESGETYTATPLSFKAFVVVHRRLSHRELARLRREQRRQVAEYGFYVLDLLHPKLAFDARIAVRV